MSELDSENICRLCCEKKGRLRSLFNWQDNNSGSISLEQIIADVTRLKVSAGDGLPQHICRTCVTTVMKMHETIERYRANDLRLRQKLKGEQAQVEIKEEEVDIDMLQEICQQNLMVQNICIKQEKDDTESPKVERLHSLTIETIPFAPETDTSPDDEKQLMEIDLEKDSDIKKPLKKKQKINIKSSMNKEKKVRFRRKKDDPNYLPRFKDFRCYICNNDPHETGEALLTHMNESHLDLLPYNCPKCVVEPVIIRTLISVNSHIKQHLNPEKCPHCDRRYSDKRGVDLHISMHHSGANKPHPSPCEICDKVCGSKLALQIHMRRHKSGVTCELCGKLFQDRNKLQRHIQTRHEKLKTYECHICKKKLASMSAVQNHIDTYHSTRVFKCSYCTKTFGSKVTHRSHEKKHIENENYVATREWKEYYTVMEGEDGKPNKLKKCNLCGILSRNMVSHLSKNHFPTEYRCEICSTVFKSKQTYVMHMKEHEHGKMFRCPICGREFADRRYLISHLRTKKHRDHPMAIAMLSTIKTPSTTQQEETETDTNQETLEDSQRFSVEELDEHSLSYDD